MSARPQDIRYYVARPPRRRGSRCHTWRLVPKKGWQTRQHAADVLNMMRRDGRSVSTLVPYECPSCGLWHLGNDVEMKAPYTFRVVDREPALIVEIGQRALAQMMAESADGRHAPRRRLIADRAATVQRRRKVSVIGSTAGGDNG